jgi:ABC-type multidrug transport system fused ATPase/permease subunit
MATRYFVDIIAGIRVIRMFNIGNTILQKYRNENNIVAEKSLERVHENSQMEGANFLLSAFNLVGVLGIGVFMISSGSTDLGTVVAIIALQSGVAFMFTQVGSFFAQLQSSLAGTKRVFELLDEPIESKRYNVEGVPDSRDMVSLKNINLGYDASGRILNGLDITVKRGQVAALVGASGSGKSTIIKLLMGFYQPESGYISIEGKAMGSYTLEDLRSKIAYVPQDAPVFDGAIEENIRYGKLSATKEEVRAAAKAANAHDFIKEFADGYDTKVGERGTRLSGGQRQRIAIARALLKDAPLLLLDEATSALDSESEQLVQGALNVLMKGRTTIIVAHRLSTIEHADVIYVIDAGKVVECGNHSELLEKKGKYYSFYFRLVRTSSIGISA